MASSPAEPPARVRPARDVPRAAIEACLTDIRARDPFIVPVFADMVLEREGLVAEQAGDEPSVIGVGWRQRLADGLQVDVLVRPQRRRHGVGGQLFDALADEGVLLANCDAGHPRAGRFVEARGFLSAGVVFHQRWDGEVSDVPRAFRSAPLSHDPDPEAVLDLLTEASVGSWPPPLVTRDELAQGTLSALVARVDGQRVGAIVTSVESESCCVGGFAVMPAHRGRGIGRALLTEVMRRSAAAGQGVTLRVSHDDDRLIRWAQQLGFWTYRTWAYYRRPAVGSVHRASDGSSK